MLLLVFKRDREILITNYNQTFPYETIFKIKQFALHLPKIVARIGQNW